MKKLFVLVTLALTSSVFAEGWDRYNNPNIYVPIMPNKVVNYNFASLPLESQLESDTLGWSGHYWPFMYGGITYRWNQPGFKPFSNKFPTQAEILSMSEDKLAELSPAELYDIYRGDYNFTFTKQLLATHNPKAGWWEGLCDGWALSAANYAEPKPVTMINKDGVRVPFGSSDVKALMAMHGVYNSQGYYVKVGRRCRAFGRVAGEEVSPEETQPSPRKAESANCRDVNAGAFHIVITNMLGIHNMSFVADVDRYGEVWNQPVTGYSSKVIGEVNDELSRSDKRRGVVKKVRVQTRMGYASELMFFSNRAVELGYSNFVTKEPVLNTPSQFDKHKDYEYILELDRSGNIIGGDWVTETRPDMMWTKARDTRFNDSKYPLSTLNEIYKPVNSKAK